MGETPENGPIRADIEALLTDIRGAIDDALVQINLGEKNLKDVVTPVIERVSNEFLDLKAKLLG